MNEPQPRSNKRSPASEDTRTGLLESTGGTPVNPYIQRIGALNTRSRNKVRCRATRRYARGARTAVRQDAREHTGVRDEGHPGREEHQHFVRLLQQERRELRIAVPVLLRRRFAHHEERVLTAARLGFFTYLPDRR